MGNLASLTYIAKESKLLKTNKLEEDCHRGTNRLWLLILNRRDVRRHLCVLSILCHLLLFPTSGNPSGKECWKNEEKTLKRRGKYTDCGLKMTAKMRTTLGMGTPRSRCSPECTLPAASFRIHSALFCWGSGSALCFQTIIVYFC